jgi:predicted glycosyltransferase
MRDIHIGYYVHHHGAGHGVRAATIASQLGYPVTLMGSCLPEEALAPHVQRLLLPPDTAEGVDDGALACLHYAPLGVEGLRSRMATLAQWFRDHWPCLLVVDVSVEVAVFARLCSIPVVYVRQHGRRDDAAHQLAYESATALLAPYPSEMEDPELPQQWRAKTFYSGWLSRFAEHPPAAPEAGRVLVICGRGGSGLTPSLLKAAAAACPAVQLRVAGVEAEALAGGPPNLVPLGHVRHPLDELRRAGVVIGSASDSLVSEAASLGCRFVAVAEDRPFDEQRHQARRLDKAGVALGLDAWPAADQWPAVLEKAFGLEGNQWRQWADIAASARAAAIIQEQAQALFKSPGARY